MKKTLSCLLLALIAISCQKSSDVSVVGRYKARFEIKGICSNYTFSIVEGNINPKWVEAEWTDPQTDITYKNAFAMQNPCWLPSGIKEGDEFYIEVLTPSPANCMVCLAYYPTPKKSLSFRVIE